MTFEDFDKWQVLPDLPPELGIKFEPANRLAYSVGKLD